MRGTGMPATMQQDGLINIGGDDDGPTSTALWQSVQ